MSLVHDGCLFIGDRTRRQFSSSSPVSGGWWLAFGTPLLLPCLCILGLLPLAGIPFKVVVKVLVLMHASSTTFLCWSSGRRRAGRVWVGRQDGGFSRLAKWLGCMNCRRGRYWLKVRVAGGSLRFSLNGFRFSWWVWRCTSCCGFV